MTSTKILTFRLLDPTRKGNILVVFNHAETDYRKIIEHALSLLHLSWSQLINWQLSLQVWEGTDWDWYV